MMTIRRLIIILLIALLIGIAVIHAGPIPERWTRADENPMLSPGDDDWEMVSNAEPSLLYEGGIWKMWYSAGLTRPAIGYATSADGVHWTKYADNPVLKGASHASIFKYQGIYYCYFSNDSGKVGAEIYRAVSTDGIHWTMTAAPSIPVGDWDKWNANSFVWVEDAKWFMLYESRGSEMEAWQIALAESADGIHWTKTTGSLTDLQIDGGAYGGPFLRKENGIYHLWYHASRNHITLPTDIYEATSTDLQHWTKIDGVALTRKAWLESDQVADPFVITVNGEMRLYYSMCDNRYFVQCWIGMARSNV